MNTEHYSTTVVKLTHNHNTTQFSVERGEERGGGEGRGGEGRGGGREAVRDGERERERERDAGRDRGWWWLKVDSTVPKA